MLSTANFVFTCGGWLARRSPASAMASAKDTFTGRDVVPWVTGGDEDVVLGGGQRAGCNAAHGDMTALKAPPVKG